MDLRRLLRIRYYEWKGRKHQEETEVDMCGEEFIDWWINTGHAHERGRGINQYCMSRIDPTLPYSTSNVECITNKEKNLKTARMLSCPITTPYGDFESIETADKNIPINKLSLMKKIFTDQPGWALK